MNLKKFPACIGKGGASLAPCGRFPWLPKFCANYTSKSLVSPSFSLSPFSIHPLLLCLFWSFFICSLPHSSSSHWMSSPLRTLLHPLLLLSPSTSLLLWQHFFPTVIFSPLKSANNFLCDQDVSLMSVCLSLSSSLTHSHYMKRMPVCTICPSISGQRAPACAYLILWGDSRSYTLLIYLLFILWPCHCPYRLLLPSLCTPTVLGQSQVLRNTAVAHMLLVQFHLTITLSLPGA